MQKCHNFLLKLAFFSAYNIYVQLFHFKTSSEELAQKSYFCYFPERDELFLRLTLLNMHMLISSTKNICQLTFFLWLNKRRRG